MSGIKKGPVVRSHNFLPWGLAATGLLVVGVLAHYTHVVVRARAETPRLMAEALAGDRIVLLPEDLSKAQLDAVLAVQDPHFFEHKGNNFVGGTRTTITEALSKYLFFERFRPGLATIRRTLIARFAIHPLVSKRDQLKLYINIVPLGFVGDEFIEGFAEGAEAFYGKSFNALTYDEFLSLLVSDSPMRLNPHVDPEANARRVLQIKRLLAGECRRPGLLNRTPNCWTEDPERGGGSTGIDVRPNNGLKPTRRG
jgi:membrane carboxypeptidase/penicillin-binding protein